MSDPHQPRGSGSDESWEFEFERLREAYRLRLRGDLAALDSNLREALDSGMAPLLLEAALRLAHRLKGTAGTYRLDETCGALEQIEERLRRLLEGSPPDPFSVWTNIQQLLQRARQGTAPGHDLR